VRVSWTQFEGHQSGTGDPDHWEPEERKIETHGSTAALQDSERRHLAKKINDIIKASGTQPKGESTGLNRRTRWTTDKIAAGSSIPATSTIVQAGNVANAQAAARKSAQVVSSPRPPSSIIHTQVTQSALLSTGRETASKRIQNA
jgi:hypothetical protein